MGRVFYTFACSTAANVTCRYGNQLEVAQGLKRAFQEIPGLRREDIFIVCAISPTGTQQLTQVL